MRKRARRLAAWTLALSLLALTGCGPKEPKTMPLGGWKLARQGKWRGTFYDLEFVNAQTGWAVGSTEGAQKALIAHTSNGGAEWTPQHADVQGPLRRAAFQNEKVGWIVGEGGIVVGTRDGGTTWTRLNLNSVNIFYDIFVGHGAVWIVGDRGAAFRSLNEGIDWEPAGKGLEQASLRAVHFIDARRGWAAGWRGRIFRTDDGGETWVQQQTPDSIGGAELKRIRFFDARRGFAVGDRRTILATEDGGETWRHMTDGSNERHFQIYGQKRRPGDEPLHSYMLYDLHMEPPNRLWVAGDLGAALKSEDGGRVWTHMLGGRTGKRGAHPVFLAIEFVDAKTGWVAGEGGAIYATNDGGNKWTAQSTTAGLLYGVCFASPKVGWAVGDRGEALRTSDGGLNWTAQDSSTDECFSSAHFIDERHGWAAAEFGVIVHTKDGGETWTKQETPGSIDLLDIYFTDKRNGWAVGVAGTVYRTTNGGVDWTESKTPVERELFAVHFVNSKVGWAAGKEGAAIRSSDGGVTWTRQSEQIGSDVWLMSVYFHDEQNGWTCSAEGRIFATQDGGQTWTEQKTGVDVPLYDIAFLDERNGWAVGGGGLILQTTDGGIGWRKRESRVDVDLTGIDFADWHNGWIVGQWGTILRYDAEAQE